MTDGVLPKVLRDTQTDTVYLAQPTGSPSGYGAITYGSPVSASARVEQVTTKRWSGDEEGVDTRHRVFTEAEVTVETRVWLPGLDQTDATLARLPRGPVSPMYDERGVLWGYEFEV